MWVMTKRVFLFVLVNILVVTTLSFVVEILARYFGVDFSGNMGLFQFCLIIGFGGAFFSLMISKWSAKMMMGVQIIDPQSRDTELRRVVDSVYSYARKAGISKMPEVGIYESPEVNAFATGPSKNNSLVAVSTGLLRRLDKDSVDGVIGHEVAHIANGDMVTMTLIQGVINALVLFLARIIARVIAERTDTKSPWAYMGIVFGLQILLSILGSIVVNLFSRWREYRADAGGARLAGRDKMIRALESLQNTYELVDNSQASVASFKISGRSGSIFAALFSTHPPLGERIKRLQRLRN